MVDLSEPRTAGSETERKMLFKAKEKYELLKKEFEKFTKEEIVESIREDRDAR